LTVVQDLINIVTCPNCKGQIDFQKTHWICKDCNNIWHLDDLDVVQFLEKDTYCATNHTNIANILQEMRDTTAGEFINTIETFQQKYNDIRLNDLIDSARADWTILGNFEEKIIADISNSYSPLSLYLAQHAKLVISVDSCIERLDILALIARYQEITNILPLHSDYWELPLRKEALDDIILFGLLGNIGAFNDQKSNPMKLQIEYLKYLHSLLKHDGRLWLGIENRLNPVYFLGSTDYGDLPFTPLLPRAFANIIYHIVRGNGYRNYTYSKHTYTKILQCAGYREIKIYYPFPDYKLTEFVLSDDKYSLLSRYLTQNPNDVSKNIVQKIGISLFKMLDYFNLAGVFNPAYIIEASA
jgi:hypothetical protein